MKIELLPEAIAPPGAPATTSFDAKPQAGFQDSNVGNERRLAWAVASQGSGQFFGGGYWTAQAFGGRYAKESLQASRVANDMATSNSVVATILTTGVTQVVGQGLALSSKIRGADLGISDQEARQLSSQIEQAWADYISEPREVDSTGRYNLHSLAAGGYLSFLKAGALLAILDWQPRADTQYASRVTLLDPDQIAKDYHRSDEGGLSFVAGVGFDKGGRFTALALRDAPMGQPNVSNNVRIVRAHNSIGRRQIVWLQENTDPRGVHSVSPIVGALTPAREEASLQELTLDKHLTHAGATLAIETDVSTKTAFDALSANEAPAGGLLSDAELTAFLDRKEAFWGASGRNRVPLRGASLYHLLPNEKLHLLQSQGDNTFADFSKALVRRAARAAGEAAPVIDGDFSEVNFSAAKMALEPAWRLAQVRRKFIVEEFYAAIFRNWVQEAVHRGVIELPPHVDFDTHAKAVTRAKWTGSGPIQPDIGKARKAQIEALNAGLITISDVLAENGGGDFEQHVSALASEREYLAQFGLAHPAFSAGKGEKVKAA